MHKGKNKKTRGWTRAEKKGSHCGSWEKEEGEMDVSVQFLAISEKRPIMWKWQGAGCNYNMFWSTCSNWRMLWQQICYLGNCQFNNSYQPVKQKKKSRFLKLSQHQDHAVIQHRKSSDTVSDSYACLSPCQGRVRCEMSWQWLYRVGCQTKMLGEQWSRLVWEVWWMVTNYKQCDITVPKYWYTDCVTLCVAHFSNICLYKKVKI